MGRSTHAYPDVHETIRAEMAARAIPRSGQSHGAPGRERFLAEPSVVAVPTPKPRIDLLINNAQVRDVFLAIVADTHYLVLMHPDVRPPVGDLATSVKEALDAIHDVYGYDSGRPPHHGVPAHPADPCVYQSTTRTRSAWGPVICMFLGRHYGGSSNTGAGARSRSDQHKCLHHPATAKQQCFDQLQDRFLE